MNSNFETARRQRFGSPSEDQLAFFNSKEAKERMDEVRKWIIKVRYPISSWTERYLEMAELVRNRISEWKKEVLFTIPNSFLKNPDSSKDWHQFNIMIDKILSGPRHWIDLPNPDHPIDNKYTVIRLYTSYFGYEIVFSKVKEYFRTYEIPEEDDKKIAAFLVELLNIDLYNKWYVQKKNFEGTVLRWIGLTHEQREEYFNLMKEDPGKRDPNIPLALDSTSKSNQEVLTPYQNEDETIPTVLRIHIHSLPNKYLKYYNNNYKKLYLDNEIEVNTASVISSICALPIEDESFYKTEEEVLLRGPFFQLLKISEENLGFEDDKRWLVLDLIMLNSNRDHPSTPQTQKKGKKDPARKLFNHLVLKHKMESCLNYYTNHDNKNQKALFKEAANESNKQLASFIRESQLPPFRNLTLKKF